VKLSICYITGRSEPHVEWALQAIAHQRENNDVIDFIIVDALERDRTSLINDQAIIDRAVQELRVIPPKPNIWQGKHRVTSQDWWAKSSASNTGICFARHDYVAFLDDCSRPGDEWLNTVRTGHRARKSVLAGAYEKIENGGKTVDHRLEHRPEGRKDCGGGWLYGCTFALPLEWCLAVNGFEEGCDGLSAEDTTFGIMLANSGYRIDFTPSLFVTLERGPQSNKFVRVDKGIPNDKANKSNTAVKRFGTRRTTEFTPNLRELRGRCLNGHALPIPSPDVDYKDWYDGQLIREMKGGG